MAVSAQEMGLFERLTNNGALSAARSSRKSAKNNTFPFTAHPCPTRTHLVGEYPPLPYTPTSLFMPLVDEVDLVDVCSKH